MAPHCAAKCDLDVISCFQKHFEKVSRLTLFTSALILFSSSRVRSVGVLYIFGLICLPKKNSHGKEFGQRGGCNTSTPLLIHLSSRFLSKYAFILLN